MQKAHVIMTLSTGNKWSYVAVEKKPLLSMLVGVTLDATA